MTYHCAGDSTVATYPPEDHPMSGWGAHLAPHVPGPVRDLAVCGATTESFLAEGHWAVLLAEVVAGDTVLIQFGHNDQKVPGVLDPRGGYASRLTRMVHDVRGLGASAVLCTSVERRAFDGARVAPSHGDYPNAVRDLSGDLAVPLIDLTAFTSWLYEHLGVDGSTRLFSHFPAGRYPRWPEGLEDDTHFQDEGAEVVAAFVGRAIAAIERRDGDRPPVGLLRGLAATGPTVSAEPPRPAGAR